MPSSCAFIRLAPAMQCGPASAARLRSTIAARFHCGMLLKPAMARSQGHADPLRDAVGEELQLFVPAPAGVPLTATSVPAFRCGGQLQFELCLRVVMSIIMHSSPS